MYHKLIMNLKLITEGYKMEVTALNVPLGLYKIFNFEVLLRIDKYSREDQVLSKLPRNICPYT